MADEASRAKKKLVASMRAKRSLEVKLENIDWEFDVLLPAVEELERQITRGKIPKIRVKK